MHHLHHQKYGHPDADTYRACCQGPHVGAPTIVWALACDTGSTTFMPASRAEGPPTSVAAMIAPTARIATRRLTVRYPLPPARAYVRRRPKHPSLLAAGHQPAGSCLRPIHRSWVALLLGREVLRDVGRARVF